MSNLLDELDEHRDREMTLGTGALLAIFFGIVLICAVFFGLGYSLGRRSAGPQIDGVHGTRGGNAPSAAAASGGDQDASVITKPSAVSGSSSISKPSRTPARSVPALTGSGVTSPAPARAVPSRQSSAADAQVAPSGSGTMVQLMAAAQAEDAQVLAAALRKRGYNAVVRNETDRLYHVQVGPFGSRAEADIMRRKLQTDGYNAILK